MKSCPECNQTYADDTLNFCLVDGSPLSSIHNPRVREQEIPTVILPAFPSPKPKSNIKSTLLIFFFLAIPITLFPPYSWGEEKLQTDADRNSPICHGDEDAKAKKDVLPIKQNAFVFGDDKWGFSVSDSRLSGTALCDEDQITLQRKLIISEIMLEYIIAFFAAFMIQASVRRLLTWRKRKSGVGIA